MARQGRPSGGEIEFQCPVHDDTHPSAGWNKKKGVWNCLACGAKGDSADLARRLGVLEADKTASSPRRRVLTTTGFEIRDAYDQLLAVHVRKDYSDGSKDLWWERDGSKGLRGLRLESLPLYGTHEMSGWDDGTQVVVAEGEKARDALKARGIQSLGTVTGAGTVPGDERLRPLLKFDVLLWPDNDGDGERHMVRVAERLTLMGKTPRFVRWAGAPAKGDAADFTGSDAELAQLLSLGEKWTADDLATPLPQGELGGVLDEVVRFVRRYIVLNEHQLRAIALWVAHTYVYPAFDTTPYLIITSAEKRSGKTRLLEVISLIARAPWLTGRVTSALLVRRIHTDAPTLLLDETDAAFGGPKESTEALRQVLNLGHRRNGRATLLLPAGRNGWDFEDYSVFCPKALAGIGTLPDTVLDRGVKLKLVRRTPGEKVERFKERDVEPLAQPVRQALERWAPSAVPGLAHARPVLPDELDDRAQDGWEPLLAIADAAGGEWPVKARATAIALSSGDSREDESRGVRLLKDIRDVFSAIKSDAIFSKDLVGALCEMEEAPWGSLRFGALNATGLAQRLKPYDITPKQVRVGSLTKKGYQRAFFKEAWHRYLAGSTPGETDETGETSEAVESEAGGPDVSPRDYVSANGTKHPDPGETNVEPHLNLFGGNVSDVSPVSPKPSPLGSYSPEPCQAELSVQPPSEGTSCSASGCFRVATWISSAGSLPWCVEHGPPQERRWRLADAAAS